MTRYNNPLPHGPMPGAQQGRPAAAQPAHPQHQDPDFAAWQAAGVPRTGGRPAASHAYGDPASAYADPQAQPHHDPYAALRPDGFGYPQAQKPAQDPYGLAGYTSPQQQHAGAQNAYPRAAQPGYPAQHDPYAAPQQGYAPAHAQQPAPAPQPYAAAAPQGYGTAGHGFGTPSAPPPASYGQPYAAGAPAPGGYGDQWGFQSPAAPAPGQSLSVDGRDYGHGYQGADHGAQGHWGGESYAAEPAFEPTLGPALAPGQAQPGHGYAGAPPPRNTFDQSYAEDDAPYEEEPRRGGSWKKVVALVACTVLVGGVLTVAYTSIMGTNSGDPTPVVKGATGPSKVKPSDPGGKQFAHADSKIMGRLGEGGAEPDPAGVRKVPVVVVGRDGSIQPPTETEPAETTRAVVAVPGLTVIDGLDNPPPKQAAVPKDPVAPKAESKVPPVQIVKAAQDPVVVNPPAKKIKAKALEAPKKAVAEASLQETAALPVKDEAPAPPKKQKLAAADPVGPKPTGAGYVAVLASVPASGSSRMDALKQFADMQQKYGTILTNKTPDIQEANLGEKGTYHRLLVGPPGSRDSASSVCTQLKAEGYAGCWVTAY